MGEVIVKVRIVNLRDMLFFEDGQIEKKEIRSLEVNALVDTGAVMLVLPQDEVAYLGLKERRKVTVRYADDRTEERFVAGPLFLEIPGDWGERNMSTDCIVGPPASEALIGQIVLEELDLMVDCVENRLKPRPESPHRPLLKLK